VQFVKTIGDAVMLLCADPVPLFNAVLDLVAVAATEGLPRLRIGVSSGAAVSRAGDWFGSPVNVASRVTGAARAGTVFVAESTRDAIGDAEGSTGGSPVHDMSRASAVRSSYSGSAAPGRDTECD
jgi:adenylate cyclase